MLSRGCRGADGRCVRNQRGVARARRRPRRRAPQRCVGENGVGGAARDGLIFRSSRGATFQIGRDVCKGRCSPAARLKGGVMRKLLCVAVVALIAFVPAASRAQQAPPPPSAGLSGGQIVALVIVAAAVAGAAGGAAPAAAEGAALGAGAAALPAAELAAAAPAAAPAAGVGAA